MPLVRGRHRDVLAALPVDARGVARLRAVLPPGAGSVDVARAMRRKIIQEIAAPGPGRTCPTEKEG
jgi:hypothetical protein